VISSLSYRAFGATSVVSYGNGRRLTLGYSTNRHQMTSMIVDNQNGTDRIIDKTYYYTTQSSQQTYYDNDGRIKKIADNLDPNYTVNYSYDAYNRLSSASGGSYGSTYYRSYSYDPWGNLGAVFTSTDNLNATSYSVALATNRVNSVTTQIAGWAAQTVNYTWDASGNLTSDGLRTYTYDAAGRQKEAGATGQNTVGYDGDGQRVRRVENWGTPVYYVRSSVLKQAAMEVVGGTLARAYVLQKGQAIAEQSTDGQFYWLHQDHLRSARKLTNTSGAVVYRGEFDPHGQTVLETGSSLLNSHKFTGYERDQATGLDYAGARMYASNTSRFTRPDPSGLKAADLKRPQTLNRYGYANNDPANLVDPDGRDPIDFLRFFLQSLCGGDPATIYSDGFLATGRVFCGDPANRFTKQILEELEGRPYKPNNPRALVCKVELRARKIFFAGVQIPGYHSYVVLIEKNLEYDDTREYFFQGLHPGNKLKANSGTYNLANAGSDYEVVPKILDGIVLRGSCLRYARAFDYVVNRINDLDFDYDASKASSNSAAYTALVYAGLPADALGDSIKKQIGFDFQLPGWGVYLPGVH
jgi:RHS repeat-associated protein